MLKELSYQLEKQIPPAYRGAWRAEYPGAAAEYSVALPEFIEDPEDTRPDGAVIFTNGVYRVSVRKHADDPVFRSRHGMIQLGISREDGRAIHDWRDLQAIKNRFAGEDAEGFELFPAERRLCDPSNYYTLWCFPHVTIKVGTTGRRVFSAAESLASQRALPGEEVPAGAAVAADVERERIMLEASQLIANTWQLKAHSAEETFLATLIAVVTRFTELQIDVRVKQLEEARHAGG